jgi:hypothetical protein
MTLRRLVFAAASGTAGVALVLAAVLGLSDGARTLGLVKWLVDTRTPYSLELTGAHLDWSPFRLRADLLLLRPGDPQAPPLFSAQAVDFSAPLPSLLSADTSRGTLRARNLSYFLDSSASSGPPDIEALLRPMLRLPAQIDIDSIHLMSRDEELWIFPLLDFRAHRSPAGVLKAGARADVGGEPVAIAATLDWERRGGDLHLDIEASVAGRDSASLVRLDGSATASDSELAYDLGLEGRYERVGDFLHALDPRAYPFSGALQLRGRVRGQLDGFELDLAQLSLTDPDRYDVVASGQLRREGSAPIAIALQVQGEATQFSQWLQVPPRLAGVFERSDLLLSLAGTLDDPLLSGSTLRLLGAGGLEVLVESDAAPVSLSTLAVRPADTTMALRVSARADDLSMLFPDALRDRGLSLASGRIEGRMDGSAEAFTLRLDEISGRSGGRSLSGNALIIGRGEQLSARQLNLTLGEEQRDAYVRVEGAIADLRALHGVGLALRFEDFDPLALARDIGVLPAGTAHPPLPATGSAWLQRATDTVHLRELSVKVTPVPGASATVSGAIALNAAAPQADIAVSLDTLSAAAWQRLVPLATPPRTLTSRIRLRPAYATLIADAAVGASAMQAVVSVDIADGGVRSLSADLYSPELRLEDFRVDEARRAGRAEKPVDWSAVADQMPDFPLHLTLRTDRAHGDSSLLEGMVVDLEARGGRVLLRRLDSRYADGELMLRGVVDLTPDEPWISLAGQGLRVPLADLAADLGLQREVRGLLSLRGGVTTRGASVADWQQQLAGRIALATSETRVSGAAYDLLMSNFLGWLAIGAGEKTTTFDCAMAQFDIREGVAHSDSLYLETPRMLATGKARLDLPADRIDVRIEPRSRDRAFQFPSAVKLEGQLSDPRLSVSGLQATADISAQALLLLPSLTLKLFGIVRSDTRMTPCIASVQ